MLFDTKALSWGDQKDIKPLYESPYCSLVFLIAVIWLLWRWWTFTILHFLLLGEWNNCLGGFHVSPYSTTHSFKTDSKCSDGD